VDDSQAIERRETDGIEVVAGGRTVVCALPLERKARLRLAALLGARVVDVREPVERADLVLVPSASPQLVGRMKAMFGDARIVVVELDDDDFDIDLGGPVKRLLRGGADGYVVADSLDELASKLAAASTAPSDDAPAGDDPVELPSTATSAMSVDDLVASFTRDTTRVEEWVED